MAVRHSPRKFPGNRTTWRAATWIVGALLLVALLGDSRRANAEPPSTAYIFPAGGQRGTRVTARIGGHYLHQRCSFELLGSGMSGPTSIERIERIWFEGPLVRLPASQRAEDYPQDYSAEFEIAPDADLGPRYWRAWNAQGATPARPFIVGDLPEIVEREVEGETPPVPVDLPVTINGRVFPREDLDEWSFTPPVGQVVTCAVAASSFGSPLEARIVVFDPHGNPLVEATGGGEGDPLVSFPVKVAGNYRVRIHDVRGEGLQSYVYRLTLTTGPWVNGVYPLGGRRGSEVAWELLTGRDDAGVDAGESRESAREPHVEPVRSRIPADLPLGKADLRWEVAGQWTNSVAVAVDDLPEYLEAEPNDTWTGHDAAKGEMPIVVPAICNGRIQRPGDHDCWVVELKKGTEYLLETQAERWGSPLDSVLTVFSASLPPPDAKELARAEQALDGSTDAALRFSPPADGAYVIRVSEQFRSRGTPRFAYRLRVAPVDPRVRLELVSDVIPVQRGESFKLAVQVHREGGFAEPVTLSLEGLPEGVTAADVVVAPNANRGEFPLQASPTARVGATRVRVVGKAKVNGAETTVVASTQVPKSPATGVAGLESLLLAVTLPTPFKFQGAYEMTYIPCGAVSRKHYTIERNGYEGPLEVCLADRQTRHLQGVTGPTIVVPAGVSEFTYPITLPPWMELGRTSRVVLMATGEVDDGQGTRHKVSFTSGDQNNQMVNLVSPSPLRLVLDRATVAVEPGGTTRVRAQIRRDRDLQSPVRIELVAPPHLRDVSATPVELTAGVDEGELTLVYGNKPGPITMPVVIRATARRGDDPLVAEAMLELVPIR